MIISSKNGTPVALADLLPGAEEQGALGFDRCADSALEAQGGALFICLETDPAKASASAEEALREGASAVVLASSVKGAAPQSGRVFFADDPLAVWNRAQHAFRGFPGRRMKLIGITGTSGKTSLSYVLGGVLAESGRQVGLIGSLGIYDGKRLQPTRETTPGAAKLAELLERMVDAGCQCAIVEISSQALAERRIAGLEFDAVCLTNIRRDHLDIHGSVESYRRAKMTVFDYLKTDGVAVCNIDDRVTEAALHMIDRPVLTVGIQPTACSVSGTPVERQAGEQTFYIVAGSDAAPVRTHITGKEHIYNCLEAAALAVAWNIDLSVVARGIERVASIPGRMERIECGQPFAVYLDRANSTDSLDAALDAIRAVTHGSVICVLCAPNDGDHSKRPLMARSAETKADSLVITRGNLPESQCDQAFDDLVGGLKNEDGALVVRDRKEAIIWALTHAGVDDAVLVVGQDVSTLDPISELFVPDRLFIRNWLYENLANAESFWFN